MIKGEDEAVGRDHDKEKIMPCDLEVTLYYHGSISYKIRNTLGLVRQNAMFGCWLFTITLDIIST